MPARLGTSTAPEKLRTARIVAMVANLCALALLVSACSGRARPPQLLPAPQSRVGEAAPGQTSASIVLAGGCFWGVQAVFQHTRGVLNAVSGYAGGGAADATYRAVSTGDTGHAEAVKISYDPSVISLGELLQVFFSVAHNPTEKDRQGPDSGPQYRSAVFYDETAQRDLTTAYIAQLDAAQLLGAPIATQVTPLKAFYPAESAHQDYATRHPQSPYIAIHDEPKLRNLQTLLPSRYLVEPVLVSSVQKAAAPN